MQIYLKLSCVKIGTFDSYKVVQVDHMLHIILTISFLTLFYERIVELVVGGNWYLKKN